MFDWPLDNYLSCAVETNPPIIDGVILLRTAQDYGPLLKPYYPVWRKISAPHGRCVLPSLIVHSLTSLVLSLSSPSSQIHIVLALVTFLCMMTSVLRGFPITIGSITLQGIEFCCLWCSQRSHSPLRRCWGHGCLLEIPPNLGDFRSFVTCMGWAMVVVWAKSTAGGASPIHLKTWWAYSNY